MKLKNTISKKRIFHSVTLQLVSPQFQTLQLVYQFLKEIFNKPLLNNLKLLNPTILITVAKRLKQKNQTIAMMKRRILLNQILIFQSPNNSNRLLIQFIMITFHKMVLTCMILVIIYKMLNRNMIPSIWILIMQEISMEIMVVKETTSLKMDCILATTLNITTRAPLLNLMVVNSASYLIYKTSRSVKIVSTVIMAT